MTTNIDGLYRYAWIEHTTRQSTFFQVTDGIIESNPEHDDTTPLGPFNGRPVKEFFDARRLPNWRYNDRCLQVNTAKKDEQCDSRHTAG